jgi:hypothetical protein
MKFSRMAALAATTLICAAAVAQPIRWNNVPSTVPPVTYTPPTISFSPPGGTTIENRIIIQNGGSQPAEAATPSAVPGRVVYLKDSSGRQIKCTGYGDNVFC